MKGCKRFAGTTVLVVAMAAFAALAGADEKADKGKKAAAKAGPPDEKAMMEMMAKISTPGEAHKRLDAVVGTFDAKIKMWMDPSQPPQESAGTAENKWILGNRYVEQRYEGQMMGQPFSGLGYTGYDNVTKKYVGTWMDTMGTGIMNMTGKSDAAGKVFNMSGMMVDPMTGKNCKITEKMTVADNDHHTFEMWGPDPTGKNYKMMEVTYTRKK